MLNNKSKLVLALIVAQVIMTACSDTDSGTQSRVKSASAEEKSDSKGTDYKDKDAASDFSTKAKCTPSASAPSHHYSSPALKDPVQILIGSDFKGGTFPQSGAIYLAGSKRIWPEDIGIQLNPGIKGQLVTKEVVDAKGNKTKQVVKLPHFPYWVDVEVIIEESLTITSTIRILGGRNVVVRGVLCGNNDRITITKEQNPAMPKDLKCKKDDKKCLDLLSERMKAYTTLNTVLAVESQQLSSTIENLKINVNGDFTDGIGLRQNPEFYRSQPDDFEKTFRGVDVFIRNVTIDGIGGHYDSHNHGDMVQLQTGTFRNLFIENFDGTTGYQGLYLPNRPEGSRILCREPDKNACKAKPKETVAHIPMEVIGTAFLKNVKIRPYTCANCVRPYIGLYTADPALGEDLYNVVLQDVTFYRDPRDLKPVYTHIVPELDVNTPEGTITMDDLHQGQIRGDLTIETEKKK